MKSLIIYFSHIGENWVNGSLKNTKKGNTQIVAEKIQKLTNADIFKVEEKDPYPYDYKECCNVAKEEFNNNKRPEIKNTLTDISKYDTIYIGSPIWWGHIAMPLFTQLEKLDFTGKTVKFYTTHEGSRLGSCPKDIEKLCKGAKIEDGLPIQGSLAENCDEKLKEWI